MVRSGVNRLGSVFCVVLLCGGWTDTGQADNLAPDQGAIYATVATGQTGALVRMSRLAPWPVHMVTPLKSRNATVRHFATLVYAIDTAADRIHVFHESGQPIGSFAVGIGTRPRDILVISPTRAYVTRANSRFLYRVNPRTGMGQAVADLSIFADSDGIPDMERMIRVGSLLFIQLRRQNSGQVVPGALAVFDLRNETLVDTKPQTPALDPIILVGPSPRLRMWANLGADFLLVSSTTEDHLNFSGGIEYVNLRTLQSEGFVVAEQDVAAMGGFVITRPGGGYFLFHTDIVPSNHLQLFSLTKGHTLAPDIVFDWGEYLDALLYDTQSRLLFMPRSAGGLYVVDTRTNTEAPGSPIQMSGVVVDQTLIKRARPAVLRANPK